MYTLVPQLILLGLLLGLFFIPKHTNFLKNYKITDKRICQFCYATHISTNIYVLGFITCFDYIFFLHGWGGSGRFMSVWCFLFLSHVYIWLIPLCESVHVLRYISFILNWKLTLCNVLCWISLSNAVLFVILYECCISVVWIYLFMCVK